MTKNTATIAKETSPEQLIDHNLTSEIVSEGVLYEKRHAKDIDGNEVAGLYNVWITLDNPRQYNSYTVEMLKGMQLAFRTASNARDVVAVVLTGAGTIAFCTGGNTKEYAEYYAGNPQEYRQYLRLFLDMLTCILTCDKPVICRVNGLRIGGGQEVGLACDFSVTQDLASFGQAGPKHGSSPLGGSTDFLPLMVNMERAMETGVLCEKWSAHKSYRMGIVMDIVPALKINGKFIPNPTVITDRYLDEYGRLIHGEYKTGEELAAGQRLLKEGEVDLSLLDQKVEELCTKLMNTFPDCTTKTLEELRKPKIQVWNANKESNRAWLSLNMMTEANAGFRAFNEGNKETGRVINFVALRQALATGTPWTAELIESLMPENQ